MIQPQDAFVGARAARWQELDTLLTSGRALHKLDPATVARAAALYRAVCSDLMRCRAAGYTPDLIGYLNGLAARGHNALYGTRQFRMPMLARLLLVEFPQALRANWRCFLLATLLFSIPCAIGVAGSLTSEDFAHAVIPRTMLKQMVDAYSKGFGEGRSEGMDAGMAGFYVLNNVGIAFRCFATGIFYGIGSVFFLVYNGLVIGTVAGYVASAGHGGNILTFMCGHAPFEITAIFISGGAGLQMGYALVATGGRTRLGSLRNQSGSIVRQILGAAMMLVIAAAIEGFWSPSAAPAPVKWAVASLFTLLVVLYLGLVGRRSR